MTAHFPSFSDLDLTSIAAKRPLNVCVVSLVPAPKNGGIGTATNGLVRSLAGDGHKVTLLYTHVEFDKPCNVGTGEVASGKDRTWRQWVDAFAADGIELSMLQHDGASDAWLQKSWAVKQFIASREFNVVYFDDWQGLGYFSMLAKRAGLAPFAGQIHCVIAHAGRQWVLSLNDEYLQRRADLEVLGMERRSLEMADVLIGPSRYLLREYQTAGFELPTRTLCQPYPLSFGPSSVGRRTPGPVDELVFFGRLEARKGLWLFCEALDRLSDVLREKTVTFLGPIIPAHGTSTGLQLLDRSASWPFKLRLVCDYDSDEAIEYLKHPGRLAVMPSLADNSPCVLYECIQNGIPFISTLGSGIEEIIDPDCHEQCLVEPSVDALVEGLERVVRRGASIARHSFDVASNLEMWSSWHRHVAGGGLRTGTPGPGKQSALLQARAAGLPLIVIVDDGRSSLRLFLENLNSHLTRFGSRCRYLVITARARPIQQAILSLLKGSPDIRICDASDEDGAKDAIDDIGIAFFLDGHTELLTPFFVLALEALAKDPECMVTCVGSIRSAGDGPASIGYLPAGALSAVSGIGQRIGGPAWAFSPRASKKRLQQLRLYDSASDRLLSAAKAGHRLMHRHLVAGGKLELLPVIGATSTAEENGAGYERSFDDMQIACQALDVAPSFYAGGPAWAIISSTAAFEEPLADVRADIVTAIGPGSPLLQEMESHPEDLPRLAATLGRTELAMQLAAADGAPQRRVKELIDHAINMAEQRPSVELNAFLDNAKNEIGARSAGGLGGVVCYADRRLRVSSRRIQSSESLNSAGPAAVSLLDVRLCGNAALELTLRSDGKTPMLMRIRVIEQKSGLEMAAVSERLVPSTSTKLRLPTHEIFTRVAIVIEFSGASKLDISLGSIRLR